MFEECCSLLTSCFRSQSPEATESQEHLDSQVSGHAHFPASSRQSLTSRKSGSAVAFDPGTDSPNSSSLEQTSSGMEPQADSETFNSQDSPAPSHLDRWSDIIGASESNGVLVTNKAYVDDQLPTFLPDEHSTPAEEVPCFICATLEGKALDGLITKKHGTTIQISSTDDFCKVEERLRTLLPQDRDGKIYLRHGTFTTITRKSDSDHPESFFDPLDGSADWEPCRATLATLASDITLSIDLNFGIVPVYQPEEDNKYADYIGNVLHDKMKRFGSKDGPDRMYIPQVDFDAIITKEAISRVVDEQEGKMQWATLALESERHSAKDQFVEKIWHKARKLFAIFVYLKLKMRSLLALLDKGASDEEPPSIDIGWITFSHDRRQFEELVKKQSWFKTFHFGNKESGQHHEVPEGTTVPISFGRQLGVGAYSTVWQAEIDLCHQRFKKYRKSEFAVKHFKNQPSRKFFFEKEHKMLVELNMRPHDHILTHITAWSQGQECYILFPLARMNLRLFLKEKQPEADSKITLWLIRQMKGLADAVKLIHNLDSEVSSTHLQIPGATPTEERKQGYHHDLKPENMLLFYKGNDYTEGLLKISDFGMGKVHGVPQGSQIISKNTATPSGTLTYGSPDYEMHKKTGRPHDMWALGCVFLELLCWLFIAPQKGGKSFQTDRRAPTSSTDSDILSDSYYFMTMKNGAKNPKLKPVVIKWMDAIEVNPCCKDEFLAILELIRKPGGLLEPDMKTRMKAGTLNDKLKEILQNATKRLEAAPNHYAANVSEARKVTMDSLDEQPLSPSHTPMMSRQSTNSMTPAEHGVAGWPEIVLQEPD